MTLWEPAVIENHMSWNSAKSSVIVQVKASVTEGLVSCGCVCSAGRPLNACAETGHLDLRCRVFILAKV